LGAEGCKPQRAISLFDPTFAAGLAVASNRRAGSADGCGTVEPVSAVATVHYLRMSEVAELGIDQPRDMCLLLNLKRDDESGTYSIAMRCATSHDLSHGSLRS